ncbi:MAG: hypothetical protein LUG52_08650 [Clostridia bacterium]|nr:hypothetical protein [Clostridia bacterium]
MTIYDAADILTGLFAAVMMVSLYNTFFEKRGGVPGWVYTAGVFLLAALINVSNQIFKYGILNALGMILSFFIISFLYKGNPLIKLIISTLTFLLMTIAEIVALFGVTIVFGITVTEAVDIPEYRLLGIIVSKTLAFFIINVVRLKYKKNKFSFSLICSLYERQ